MSRIGILGYGVTGKGIVRALKDTDELFVYDTHLPEDIAPLTHETNVDFIIKSPGLPPDHEEVRFWREKGIEIISDLEAFYRLYHPQLVAITGTNGKTTVTSAVDFLLPMDHGVGGNIGKSVFDLTQEAGEIVVLECSSFQLADTKEFHPHVACITNLTSDHLDWHKSVDHYRESKKKIAFQMTKEDWLILDGEDPVLREMDTAHTNVAWVSTTSLPDCGIGIVDGEVLLRWEGRTLSLGKRTSWSLPGTHNGKNLAMALLVGVALGMDPQEAMERLSKFQGVRHRLEKVGESEGVLYFNDSKGTNPDATDVALSSFSAPIHLIAGGYDKGSDMRPLLEKYKSRIKGLYLFGQTAESMNAIAEELGIKGDIYDSLEEAVSSAKDGATSGEVVLLSPACASWGMYKNYEERGDEFCAIVKGFCQ